MKWIGRTLYIFLIIVIGVFTIKIAESNRQLSYYNDVVVPYLTNNEKDNYLEGFMTANIASKYLKDPVYQAVSNDPDLPMDLSVYHVSPNEQTEFLIFYFDDRPANQAGGQIKYPITNQEQYDLQSNEVNNLVSITLNVYLGDINFLTSDYYSITIDHRMPVALIQLDKKTETADKEFFFNWMNADKKTELKSASYISKIEVILDDKTFLDETPVEDRVAKLTPLIEITHTDDFAFISNDILINDKGVMKSSNFNGNIDNFDVSNKYSDESLVVTTNQDPVKPYQKIITKTVTIFVIIVTVITFLLFFFKPLMNYFNNKRDNVEIASDDMIEASAEEIFRDNPEE